MGVSGCGKTTVAAGLAERLGWQLAEADMFHSPANVEKMRSSIPLTDEDRWPWLDAIAKWIDAARASGKPGVITCSALKRRYREIIVGDHPDVRLVYLKGDYDLIAGRMAARTHHYMPVGLLQSQFDALEAPGPDENALVVSIESRPEKIISEIVLALRIGMMQPMAATDADRNPQAEQMGDESMARNLAHQAEAIWPQERPLFVRYGLAGPVELLDLGCGTGEITRRLAEIYPQARLTGVDILEGNLALARAASASFGDRIRYQQADAFALPFAPASFDLVVCRHVSQAVPDFHLVVEQVVRCLKPRGWLHLLSEDYGMLRMPGPDADRFWIEVALRYLDSIGCDGRIGRHSWQLLKHAGFAGIAVDYVVVDTVRVPRSTFAGIIRAWRDGYTQALAESSGWPEAQVRAHFTSFIAAIEDPDQYAVWHIPVVSGRKP